MEQLPNEILSHIITYLSFNDIKSLLSVSKKLSDCVHSCPNSYHTSHILIHSQNIDPIIKSEKLFASDLCQMKLSWNAASKREVGSKIMITVSDDEIDKEKTNSLLRKLKAGHFGNLFISGMFNGDDKYLDELPQEKVQDFRDPRSIQDHDGWTE